jgi:catechol 2,3-dioxygenase-like lactoylglutathione lyase family enzyme
VSALLRRIGAITLFVDDLPRSRSFYRDVFGGPVLYEDVSSVVFDFDNTIINLLEVSAAQELVEPEPVAPQGVGARHLLSIWVDDVDAICVALVNRGVELISGPIDRTWGKRTASFADPDGNLWEVAQDIPAGG